MGVRRLVPCLALAAVAGASPPSCSTGSCHEALSADFAGEGGYLLQRKSQGLHKGLAAEIGGDQADAIESVATVAEAPAQTEPAAAAVRPHVLELAEVAAAAAAPSSAGAAPPAEPALAAELPAEGSMGGEFLAYALMLPLSAGALISVGLWAAARPAAPLREQLSKYLAEFVGTFVLVFTVGCCVLVGSATWNALAIACVLMSMIYATAYVSGGNLNPAVSLALGLVGSLSWVDVVQYWIAQLAAGLAASLLAPALLGGSLALAPVAPYTAGHALTAELAYTAVLCFVVLNCAASKRNNNQDDSNQFFALAIGFVVVAGGHATGGISGGCLNPAVAMGLDARSLGLGWGLSYSLVELAGALVAAVLFRIVRPEEQVGQDLSSYTAALGTKLASEFLGTFVLVLTVGLNVVNGSPATALSAAAALMSMIYALGDVSGAHFNPAVTVACVARGACTLTEGIGYSFAQIAAGISAGIVTAIFHAAGPNRDVTYALQPGDGYTFSAAGFTELFFTFVLAYVVLAVATTKPPASQLTNQNFYFALAIGSCVTAGGFCVGAVSGGELNPAVSVGISIVSTMSPGSAPLPPWTYVFGFILMELIGGICAATLFRFTHPKEFSPNSPLAVSKLVCEFVGTYVLVFTVGCCVLTGSGTWNATAIASVLTAMIYATGPVSGGNLNPAVSFALGLSGDLPWSDVRTYWLAQLSAGAAAGGTFLAILAPRTTSLQPVAPFEAWHALVAEVIFTAVLCFVVLNCAVSKRNNPTTDGNQFYALAIGFVIIAGGHAAGGISGACFNPAVALGVDIKHAGLQWGAAWAAAELVGAAVAVALFKIVRPEESKVGEDFDSYVPALVTRAVSEFLGTFVLVFTVGLNVVMASPAVAWSAAAALMCMIYALGNVSGAHFNPAVTLAVVTSGRDKCSVMDGLVYVVVQLLAGVSAGLLVTSFHLAGPNASKAFPLAPGGSFSLTCAGCAEFFFTFVLSYVVLAVATTKAPKSLRTENNFQFGLAIASCVTAGGFAVGAVSGGELNPAVAFGIATQASSWANVAPLVAWELSGALLASLVFRLTHPAEFAQKA